LKARGFYNQTQKNLEDPAMKKFYENVQPYKFRLTIFALLCGATLLSLLLFRLRVELSGSMTYMFLIWNIFLAWIPLVFAHTAATFSWKRKYILLTVPFFALLWLLFFPNAPYILTDLQHLSHPKPGVPVWFDVLLIVWFSWTGLLLGMVSLLLMQNIVRREFGRVAGWLFVFAVGALGSLGIYIGRFLRWNSWDMFFHPFALLSNFTFYATHPSLRSIIFIGVFATFFIFFYITIYAFGFLLQEQTSLITPQEKI
jgi:uncharacterized membrane protein